MSKISDKYLELQEQAEYFGLELDFETLEFIPKSTYIEPLWLTNWKDKVGDFDPRLDIDRD